MSQTELNQDLQESEATRARMREILIQVAEALKGKPQPLHSHDWSDLPKRATELMNELHTGCPSCGTQTNPDIKVCPKCLDAWIGGKGCEWLDKMTATLRKQADEDTERLAYANKVEQAARAFIEVLDKHRKVFGDKEKAYPEEEVLRKILLEVQP